MYKVPHCKSCKYHETTPYYNKKKHKCTYYTNNNYLLGDNRHLLSRYLTGRCTSPKWCPIRALEAVNK